MKRVAGGDFKIRLKDHSKIKEIGELNRSFNAMTEELGVTEVLQSDFVSNVSHEIKTPLNAIEGHFADRFHPHTQPLHRHSVSQLRNATFRACRKRFDPFKN